MIKPFKFKWPWVRNRKLIDERYTYLKEDINIIKKELMNKRVANFCMVVNYKKGMNLCYELPKPILLVDLEKRIKALENKGQAMTEDHTGLSGIEKTPEASMTTKDQDNEEMRKILELIIPAFGKLPVSTVARPLLGRINDCLASTPYMYFVFGDGVEVVRREDMYELNKSLFNADTFVERR